MLPEEYPALLLPDEGLLPAEDEEPELLVGAVPDLLLLGEALELEEEPVSAVPAQGSELPVLPVEPDPVLPDESEPVLPEDPDPVLPEEPEPVLPEDPDPVLPEEPDPVLPDEPEPVPPLLGGGLLGWPLLGGGLDGWALGWPALGWLPW